MAMNVIEKGLSKQYDFYNLFEDHTSCQAYFNLYNEKAIQATLKEIKELVKSSNGKIKRKRKYSESEYKEIQQQLNIITEFTKPLIDEALTIPNIDQKAAVNYTEIKQLGELRNKHHSFIYDKKNNYLYRKAGDTYNYLLNVKRDIEEFISEDGYYMEIHF